jgi:glycosyltransferase involved in cell wall biosynthesis
VESQQSVNIDHIIVDGASTDGTVDFLRGLDGVDWSSEKDNGRYDAMNRGISRASTDLVWLMHAGDTFGDSSSVAKVLESYSAERWPWAYGFSRVMDAGGEMVGYFGFSPFDIRALALGSNVVSHQAAIFERRLHDEIGRYDEDFGLAADQLYMLKLAMRFPPRVLGEFLNNFDSGGVGSHRRVGEHIRDMRRARKLVGYSATGSYTVDSMVSMGMIVWKIVKVGAKRGLRTIAPGSAPS